MAISYPVLDFPTLGVQSQLFYAGGMAIEGGLTAGGARVVGPEPGGRAFLEMHVSLQVNEWNIPFASWLMSKAANGTIFRVPLVKTPQLVGEAALESISLSPATETNGVPWEAYAPSGGISAGGVSASFDFPTGNLDGSFNFFRASTATYFGLDGVLRTAAANEPRVEVGGLLIEPASVNYVANSEFVGTDLLTGIVPGWSFSSALLTSGSIKAVGQGVEDGMSYVDLRIQGTNSTGSNTFPSINLTARPTAVAGQTWVMQGWFKHIAGNLDSLLRIELCERNISGSYITSSQSSLLTIGGTNRTKRTISRTFVNAATALTDWNIFATVAPGASIDLTLRVYNPQLEEKATETSYIPTANAGPVSRAADYLVALNSQDNAWTITYDNNTQQVVNARGDLQLDASNITRSRVKLLQAVRTANDAYSQTVPWDNGKGWSSDVLIEITAIGLEGSQIIHVDTTEIGPVIQYGHVFGIGDHSYIVDDIEYSEDATNATITVNPPLRQSVTAGDFILLRPYFLGTVTNIAEFRTMYERANNGHIQPGRLIFAESLI